MAEKYMIKPYALLTVEAGVIFQIMRYNVVSHEWEVLPGSYMSQEDAQAQIDELNEESERVPFIIG